ncbi:hypothetical protein GCM10027034_30370 [Ramlibacter solisilvae]|uniref:hypothetical protein n=1 Tax=Ramlibacter tataouinensis TaxID=94132 RepID=UPI000776D312|nr:hypothetical protein [Ramlibacter tataouinensis]
MAAAFASIIDFVLTLVVAPIDQESSNRVSVEGLTLGSRDDGALEIGVRKFEAAAFHLASGSLMLELGHLALHQMVALVRMEAGRPRLCALEAASAQLSGVKVNGPLILSRQPKGDASGNSTTGQVAVSSWCLAPLAAANGRIRAEIIDAHLLFDADVTVPILQGQVNFNDATVEHLGPDSRMGVSRRGIYVDAPNGRSYLYQFSSAPAAGVEYEQRGAMLGPRVKNRGNLQLQAFAEGLLRQPRGGLAQGFTEQTRLLFDRTAVSGEVRLGDGRFAATGVQADLVGRADGSNEVRLHSEAVGRGLTVEMASMAVRNAQFSSRDRQLSCDQIAGELLLRSFVEGGQLRFAFELANMNASGLRLQLDDPKSGGAS